MPANMPHKGLTVLDGRLDPKVWGRMPYKNLLAGIDGTMIAHGLGNHNIGALDPRLVGDTTASLTGGAAGITLNTSAVTEEHCALISREKVRLAGNRFILECVLNFTSEAVADGDCSFFIGFCDGRVDPVQDLSVSLLDSTASVGGSFGLFKKAAASELDFSEIVDLSTATQEDTVTGIDLVAGNTPVKMVSTGTGKIEIYSGSPYVLQKTVTYPSVAQGHLVASVKNLATDASVVGLGNIVFAVAE